MHLGLIDGTFVPYNLTSTQESPVPLLRFQLAPRLNKKKGLRRQERAKDILLLFSQKYQQTNPLQVPQQGPYGERYPFRERFAYLSITSQKFL
jgi:hypothetical protein